MIDGVYQSMDDGGWYFLDEIGDDYGPFETELIARRELDGYCIWLNYGPLDNHLFFSIR